VTHVWPSTGTEETTGVTTWRKTWILKPVSCPLSGHDHRPTSSIGIINPSPGRCSTPIGTIQHRRYGTPAARTSVACRLQMSCGYGKGDDLDSVFVVVQPVTQAFAVVGVVRVLPVDIFDAARAIRVKHHPRFVNLAKAKVRTLTVRVVVPLAKCKGGLTAHQSLEGVRLRQVGWDGDGWIEGCATGSATVDEIDARTRLKIFMREWTA
jgi:hypothetical protein